MGLVFENLETVVNAAVTAFVAYKAAVGISTIVEALTRATEGQTIAQTLLNAAMNANPLAAVIALIAGLVAAVITLWNTNEDFREAVKKIWGTITDTIGGAVSAVVKFFTETIPKAASDLLDAVKRKIDELKTYFSVRWDAIKAVFAGVKTFFVSAFTGGMNGIKSAFSGIRSFFSQKWTEIKNVFSGVKEWFHHVGANIVNGIKEGISSVWEGAAGLGKWLGDKVSGLASTAREKLGEHSPSRVFADIGANAALGLGEGWRDKYDRIRKQIADGLTFPQMTIPVPMTAAGMAGEGGSAGTSATSPASDRPITIIVRPTLDGRVIGESVTRYQRNRDRANGA